MREVGIIGGGAAGIMAAITAVTQGAKATILEHQSRIGKKILMTGNGKCNLTNLHDSEDDYYCDRPDFVSQMLEQFQAKDTIALFREFGLLCKEKNGGVYPITEQASSVLDILQMELDAKKVTVLTQVQVNRICKPDQSGHRITVETTQGDFTYDAVILACGGCAHALTGSDGSGYKLARMCGHHIIQPLPALVQLKCQESYYKSIAGVRCTAGLQLLVEGTVVARELGELQVTDYGISGIAVFQFSRIAAKALYAHKKVTVCIDYLPQLSDIELKEIMSHVLVTHPFRTIEEVFLGIINKKLLRMILKQRGIPLTQVVSTVSPTSIQVLLTDFKNWTVQIKDTLSFEHAQVCCGGVDCTEVRGNCESTKMKGLYLAGELLDVDAKCGGYNLQWAWTTGYVAGSAAAGSSVTKGFS